MGLISGTKRMVRDFIGTDRIRKQTQGIASMAKNIFAPQSAQRTETFEQALERFNLTEQDVKQKISQFGKLVAVLLVLSFLIFCYLIYLLFHHAWMASLGSLGVLCVLSAQAFRYHFWIYQMRERRLGCSFREWFAAVMRRGSGSTGSK